MRLTIDRIEKSKDGCFGVLLIDGSVFCLTLERPWKDNKKSVSCIPEGHYIARRILSPKYGVTYEVTDVDSRTEILFHWGNYVCDSKGCVLLGTSYGIINEKRAILSSKKAFNLFIKLMNDTRDILLEIK